MEIERLRLQYEITKAQLLYEVTPARLNISVKRGQVDIQHEPLKLTIENQSFDSVGIKADTPREQAQSGKAVLTLPAGTRAKKSAESDPGAANSPKARPLRRRSREGFTRAPQGPKMTWSGGRVTIEAGGDEICVDWDRRASTYLHPLLGGFLHRQMVAAARATEGRTMVIETKGLRSLQGFRTTRSLSSRTGSTALTKASGFALLDTGSSAGMMHLQCGLTPHTPLHRAGPFQFLEDTRGVPRRGMKKLEAESWEALSLWFIAVIPEDFRAFPVILKSPVAINFKQHLGIAGDTGQPGLLGPLQPVQHEWTAYCNVVISRQPGGSSRSDRTSRSRAGSEREPGQNQASKREERPGHAHRGARYDAQQTRGRSVGGLAHL